MSVGRIQEKKVISLEVNDIKNIEKEGVLSEIVKFCDISWQLKVKVETKNDSSYLAAYAIVTDKPESALWSCAASLDFHLLKKNGTSYSKNRSVTVDNNFKSSGFAQFIDWEFLTDDFYTYLVDGDAKLELHIGISSKKMLSDFTMKSELTDVEVTVEDRKMYLIKPILSIHSPVFYSMFYGDFKEKVEQEIVISDATFNEFAEFLNFIYNFYDKIDDDNYQSLLKLAHKYNVALVRNKCEEFLILSQDVKLADKIEFAEKFDLPRLMNHCLDSMRNPTDFKKIGSGFKRYSEATKDSIMSKMLKTL